MLFVRRESFKQFTSLYPIVSWLIGLNLLFFVLQSILPTNYPPVGDVITFWGIGWNEAVSSGQYWRLVTPIFLHGDLSHFLFNTFSLYLFGPALERIIGKWKFTISYLVAGIVGNLGTFLFASGHFFHLGASGAIYGLLGMYLYMKLYRKDLIDPSSAQVITTIIIIGIIYTFIMPKINIYGHLFGFIGGLGLGPLFLKSKYKYY